VISNSAGSATSEPATLTVKADTGRKISLSFSEGAGTATSNSGDLEGSGTFVQRNDFPIFSTNVPIGALAPASNRSSIDFGTIADGQGGRAVDFVNAFGNSLGAMNQFTVTGWLNSRDLRVGSGGNRIAFALAAANGPGFDLVQMNDGSLQLGVNQWPDNTPARSSAGYITEDPEAGAANWVFFAVTYDGTAEFGNVQYFFGTPTQAAQLDGAALDYNRGPIVQSGALTIGNFGSAIGARNETGPGASRVFRGLMDEIRVFTKVLTPQEIEAAQKAPAQSPVAQQVSLAATRDGAQIVLEWDSAASLQLQSTDRLPALQWTNVAATPERTGARNTVRLPIGAGTQFFRVSGN
jgi:hypothetical protein